MKYGGMLGSNADNWRWIIIDRTDSYMRLAAAAVVQGYRDGLKGDEDAITWLQGDGLTWAAVILDELPENLQHRLLSALNSDRKIGHSKRG